MHSRRLVIWLPCATRACTRYSSMSSSLHCKYAPCVYSEMVLIAFMNAASPQLTGSSLKAGLQSFSALQTVLGSARVSRVGFGAAPKRTFSLQRCRRIEVQRKVRDREDALASTRDPCATLTSQF